MKVKISCTHPECEGGRRKSSAVIGPKCSTCDGEGKVIVEGEYAGDWQLYGLDPEQKVKARAWLAEVDPPSPDDLFKHGAIGGEVTYTFTPTSLGVIARVIYTGPGLEGKQEIDLTEYEAW